MRSVCGCTPASSAATLMMYTARSSLSMLSTDGAVGSPSARIRSFPGSRSTMSVTSRHAEVRTRRVVPRVLQLLQELLLTFRQLAGHVDVDRHEEVAVTAALRRTLALDAERLPARRPGRDLQRDRPVQRRDLHLRAERRFGIGHRQLEGEVVTLASEDAVALDANANVQIAGRNPRAAGLPLAGELDARAVLHA